MILGVYIFIIIAIFLGIYYKKDPCEFIMSAILGIILTLFIFGLLNIFLLGLFIIVMFSIYSSYFVIKEIINKRVKISNIFTKGTIIYLFVLLFLFFLYKDSLIICYDEFTAWGLFAKTTFLSNKLYLYSELPALAKNYMSGTAIFQGFLEIFNFQFNEGTLFFAIQSIYFSFVINLFSKRNKLKFFQMILYLCIFICIPLSMYLWPVAYYSILVDTILGLIFAYILVYYFSSDNSNLKQINLSLLFFFICCSKSNGFILGLMALFIIYFDLIILNFKKTISLLRKDSDKNKLYNNINLKKLLLLLLPSISLLTTFIIWNIVLKVINILPDDYSYNSSSILFAYRTENFKNWFNVFIDTTNSIIIDYKFFLITSASIVVFLETYLVKFSKQIIINILKKIAFLFSFFIMIVIYIFFLYSVCSTMSGWEIALEALRRYLYTIVAACLLLFSFYVVNTSYKKKIFYFPIIFLVVLYVSTPLSFQLKKFVNMDYVKESIDYRKQYNIPNSVLDKINWKKDRAFIVYSNEIDIFIANYISSPISFTNIPSLYDNIDLNGLGNLLFGSKNVQPFNYNIMTKYEKELSNQRLSGKTFIYFYKINDEISERYFKILNIKINQNDLYEVIENKDKYELVLQN